ncbi:MAG: hypothetical protein WD824_16870 [Cyclobacteriaceae bacterium]
MKTFTILAVVFVCTLEAFAQPNSTVPKNIRAANTLDNLFDANGLATFDNLYGIPLEPGRVIGNTYLNPDWRRTTFLLYEADRMIEDYPARYEIDQDQFEIKVAKGVKVLSGKKVKSFVWVDSLTRSPHYFVNAKDLKNEDNSPLNGFFEVLSEGELTLLSRTGIVVKKPNYNEKLDMGTRDERILKKSKFYITEKGKVKELAASRKKLLPVFGEHAAVMEEFIRKNALSLNEPAHLKAIFENYNAKLITN